MGPIANSAMHMDMNREVSSSNLVGVKQFCTRLLFESNSSYISRFIFSFSMLVCHRWLFCCYLPAVFNANFCFTFSALLLEHSFDFFSSEFFTLHLVFAFSKLLLLIALERSLKQFLLICVSFCEWKSKIVFLQFLFS